MFQYRSGKVNDHVVPEMRTAATKRFLVGTSQSSLLSKRKCGHKHGCSRETAYSPLLRLETDTHHSGFCQIFKVTDFQFLLGFSKLNSVLRLSHEKIQHAT